MAHININLISSALTRAVDVTLILPTKVAGQALGRFKRDDYYQKKKDKKYPLLILLHGYLNDEKSWTSYARAELFAEENNIAIVMISGENKFYNNYDHKVTYDHFYDFIEYELKDFLYGTFPISNKRCDNFIAGLSMGGYGALYHGLKNPDAYSAIGAFSPPYISLIDKSYNLKDIIKYSDNLPSIYLSCGDKDKLVKDSNKLDSDMKAEGINHEYRIVPGYDHEWRFWDLELERFIKGLKRTDAYVNESPRRV